MYPIAMEFFRRADGVPASLGVFPGTFNPITIAHLALAEAAGRLVDEVVFVLPRTLPHKEYSGASLEQRAGLLLEALAAQDRVSIASTAGGLFVEIADECRERYGARVKLSFVCGADAAERIAGWDYGDPGAFARMREQFDLLVAERGGRFGLPHRPLDIPDACSEVSATEVRARVARGDAWEHLVPAPVRVSVRRLYGRTTG